MLTLANSTPRQRYAALKERAKKMAHKAIMEGVELMCANIRDDRLSAQERRATWNDLEDRYGTPRSTRVASIDETAMAVKMIELKEYEPPATFNPTPPVPAAMTNGTNGDAAHRNGNEAEDEAGEGT